MNTQNDSKIVVIKYGGNAIVNPELTKKILTSIVNLQKEGFKIVIVHGGGPFIKQHLELAGIESEFIDGQRKTDAQAMKYIEMTLKGEVNGNLVREINSIGGKAVGLSGKDGQMAIANKRYHYDENKKEVDIGQVGSISKVNPDLIYLLLENNFIPVIASVATGEDGIDYNINADNFAGFIAGGIKAAQLLMLTDVDGLMIDPEDETTLITTLKADEILDMEGKVIKGGMLPKTEACKFALDNGAERAVILNGTKPELLEAVIKNKQTAATIITK